MNKIKIKFGDRTFQNDQEAWAYIDGFCMALGHEGAHWKDTEFEKGHDLDVDGTIFSSIEEWVYSQG